MLKKSCRRAAEERKKALIDGLLKQQRFAATPGLR
jgi:hypothetical protein